MIGSILRYCGWALLALVGTFALVVIAYLLGSEWAHNVLLAFDQYGNAVLGGDPDETISSRLGKWLAGEPGVRRTVASVVCAVLDLFEHDHCRLSVDVGVGGKAVVK